jgi:hypothetical protein
MSHSRVPKPLASYGVGMSGNDETARLSGYIQITDVDVEFALGAIWLLLVGDGIAQHLVPRDFKFLHEQGKTLIAKADLAADVRAAATDVYMAAADAHQQRNELLHDVWTRHKESGEFRSLKLARKRSLGTSKNARDLLDELSGKTLADFAQCLTDLQRVRWRLGGLYEVIRSPRPPEVDDDALDDWAFDFALAKGNFEMSKSGDAVTLCDW